MESLDISNCNLYLCTAWREDMFWFLQDVIAGGVDIIQLRDYSLPDKLFYEKASALSQFLKDLGVPFILNNRPDISLLTDADGLHVGQDDLSPALARNIIGDSKLVGLSTHGEDELLAAQNQPINYISVGPVEETATKPGRKPTGTHLIEFATKNSRLPFFVTGNVNPNNIATFKSFGATRFVVVRYLTQASYPKEAAKRLKRLIET